MGEERHVGHGPAMPLWLKLWCRTGDLRHALEDATRIADQLGVPVTFTFNRFPVNVMPGDSGDALHAEYHRVLAEHGSQDWGAHSSEWQYPVQVTPACRVRGGGVE